MTTPGMSNYLAQVVTKAMPEDNSVRVGTVISIDGGSVRVLVNGGGVDCGFLASYAPQIGDTVALMRQGAGWLVMGAIGGGVAVPAETGASVQYRYLTSDNPRISTATFETDPSFVFDAEPNTVYGLDALIVYAAGAGLFQHRWLFPSGRWLAPTYLWDAGTADAVAVAMTTYPAVGGLTSGYSATGALGTAQAPIWVQATLVTGDDGGKVSYQWSQTSSNLAATTLREGTRMKLERYGPA